MNKLLVTSYVIRKMIAPGVGTPTENILATTATKVGYCRYGFVNAFDSDQQNVGMTNVETLVTSQLPLFISQGFACNCDNTIVLSRSG